MMNRQQSSQRGVFWLVAVSTVIALTLMIVSLPEWLFYFWPDWIALVVVYWALTSPDRVGPLVGFVIGTLLEVLFVRKFGVQGLGLATLAFFVNRSSQQLGVLSLWQQAMVIGLFVAILKLVTGWLYGMIADFTITWQYWYSLFGDMLVWPFVFILLQELRNKFRV